VSYLKGKWHVIIAPFLSSIHGRIFEFAEVFYSLYLHFIMNVMFTFVNCLCYGPPLNSKAAILSFHEGF
jgi:hypothetical protein